MPFSVLLCIEFTRRLRNFGVAAACVLFSFVANPMFAQNVTQVPYVVTAAGSGTAIYDGDGGPARSRGLDPLGAAFDRAGNLYIADAQNNRIRRVDAANGIITTVAGTGVAGYNGDNIQATSAQLTYPGAVVFDAAGNLYIADTRNYRIRKLDIATGVITTVAGNGTRSDGIHLGDGGLATSAVFDTPSGLAFDPAGNLYIADEYNSRIRKVAAGTQIITTYAGTGNYGYNGDGVAAATAELNAPTSVAVDGAGNLYIADLGNSRIRKVDAVSQLISTVAGNGTGTFSGDGGLATAAALNLPSGVALDSAGSIYIADSGNYRVRKVNTAGIIFTIEGNGTSSFTSDGGIATAIGMDPGTVFLDPDGNVYVTDLLNSRVLKAVTGPVSFSTVPVGGSNSQLLRLSFNTSMTLSNWGASLPDYSATLLGSCDPSLSTPTICEWTVQFAPTAPGPRWGSFVVSDGSNQKYSFGLVGTGGAPSIAFSPGMITSLAGDGTGNFGGDGGPASNAQVYVPVAVAVDSSGNVYFSENGNNDYRVRKVSNGLINTVAGNGTLGSSGDGGPAIAAQLYYPAGLSVDSANNLYIADTDNSRIRKVDINGIISTVAGLVTSCGAQGFDPWGDGCPATTVQLYNPLAVVADAAGNLFIADTGSSRILKVDSFGILTTVAGNVSLGPGYNSDGIPATGAQLNFPRGIALDSVGNLYIADTNNFRVRKVDTNGIITTVAGNGLLGSAPDGSLAAANPMGVPFAVAFDAAGNLYIADNTYHVIRKVDPLFGSTTRIAGLGGGCAGQTDVVGDGCSPYNATFSDNGLMGIAVDSAGNLYIADAFHNRVRKVNVSDPPALQFPDTTVGGPFSPTQYVTVENRGNADMWVTLMGMFGDFNYGLPGTTCAITGNSGLVASGSCIIGFDFAPSVSGARSGSFVLWDNSLYANPAVHQIQLSGNGVPTQAQNISFPNPGTLTYGVPPVTLGAAATSGLPVTYAVLSGPATVSGSTLTISGAGNIIVRADQPGDPSWAPADPVTITIVVSPAVLTVVADNKSMGAGSKLPTLTSSYFGFVNGETTAVLTNSPLLQTAATSNSAAGTYDISVAQGTLTSPNYIFNFVPGKLTINPDALTFFNNFFVTGDYAVGTTNLQTGTGTIAMGSIPLGAQFVAAFLYWQTVEQPASAPSSTINFRNYPVLGGQQLGSDLAFTHAGTIGVIRTYRANVLPYLPVTDTGLSNAIVTVSMPAGWVNDSRHAIGATLLVVYRVLSNQRDSGSGQYTFPLKAVVIYDGSWAAPSPGMDMFQSLRGFYDTPTNPSITVIANDGTIWTQHEAIAAVSGDHVNLDVSSVAAAGIAVLSTAVNADSDGLLAAWKTQNGYFDARDGTSWVDLPGATVGQQDVFVQIDYMCSNVLANGTCDPAGHSHMPSLAALQNVAQAFQNHNINVHFDIGNNYQGQPHIVAAQFARGGNIIPEQACIDTPGANPPNCVVPNEAGMIGWKMGLGLLKMAPRDTNACANTGDCSPRFAHGRKDSYHYVVFGHSVVSPAWSFTNGYLSSIAISGNTATVTTSAPHGLKPSELDPTQRVTISESISQPYLNGIYVPARLDDYRFTIQTSNVSGTVDKNSDPGLSVYSGRPGGASGFSDIGGADSVISLGNWKFCLNSAGHITKNCAEDSPQNDSIRLNVEAGTFMHELGHSIGLTHGGAYLDTTNSYLATYESNCKPNYQSVMNYLFQIDLLGGTHSILDFSGTALAPIDESNAGSSWSSPYSWTSWYSANAGFPPQSPATTHCDGTPTAADEVMYRTEGNTLTWMTNQDVNFNGKHDDKMRGYDDWDNLNLRQIGATGSHFVSGGVLLPNGGGVILPNGGGILLPNGGGVLRPDGGVILPNGGGVLLPNGGGVLLPNGGGVLLADGGVILPNSGGVLLPNGGGVILPNGGGTVWSGATGVILPNGGGVLLANGGGVVLPNGGGVILPNGGGVILPNGGGVVLPNGGGVLLANGGGVLLPNGGGVVLPNGGGVVLPNGGGVVLPNGGGVLLPNGGGVVLPNGGGTLFANQGGVLLPNGGGVLLPNGGGALLANGGGVVLPNGGGVTLPNGGGVILPNGGGVLLPNGGGIEMTYEAANSVVRPPIAPSKTPISGGLQLDWTAPNFGVISAYTVYRGDGSVVPCPLTGNPPPTTCTVYDNPPVAKYYVATTVPDELGHGRQSQSAVLKFRQTITLTGVPAQAVFGDGPVSLQVSASSKLPVNMNAGPNCSVTGTVLLITGAGTCNINVSQLGDDDYYPAFDVTQSFPIAKANAVINVASYNVPYDGNAHIATAIASGVDGADLSASVNLSATAHTAIGDYPADRWSFAGAPNYNDAGGTVHDIIAGWKITGFYAPVSMSSGTQITWNTVKGGSTVPLKFNIYAGSVERKDVSAVKGGSVALYAVNCTAGLTDPISDAELVPFSDTGSTSLRYDASAGHFIQNWKTPRGSGTCYAARVTAADGTAMTGFFQTKSK